MEAMNVLICKVLMLSIALLIFRNIVMWLCLLELSAKLFHL